MGFSGTTLWMLGASIGSLFDQPSLDFGSSSPNYSFSEVHNSKSQLLPIPICYGRVRVAGNVFMQQFYDDKRQKMDMFVGLSQGPIHRVISVYANEHVLFGDGSDTYTYWTLSNGIWLEVSYPEYVAFEGSKEIRDGEGNVATVDLQECSCDVHLGEPGQLKDSRESGELTYGRVAYLGITVKVQEGLTGNPTITTEFEGREIWTPSGTRYTANPVWCITDLLTNKDYGVGVPLDAINIPAASDAAAYCDELVDGRPRYSLNYIIDQQRPAPDILRDMFMCFDGYIREREQITICVNRPVSTPDAYLVVDDVAKQGTFSWWQKGREETYNRVIVEWVDPENHYERTSTPFEAQADMESRGLYERNISLLGVTDPCQAARLGEQALHVAQTINNFCSFTVSVCDWDFEIGDVIGITESAVTGWNRKWFHVLHMQDDPQSEECTVTLVEYDSSTYVNTPSQVPATNDNPNPPAVLDNYSNLILTDVGSQQADGTYVPKIRVRYTPPTADMKEHVVSWWHNDDGKAGEKKISPSVRDVLISEGIETGKVLTVRVWGTDINGKPRTGVVGQIVPGHDDIAPSPPTSLTTEGWFGEIILNWVNPTTNEDGSPCKDLAYIEVWASSTDDRTTAVKIGEVNGTNFRHHLGSFAGRYYWIRAVDTSGNVSQWNALAGTYGYSDLEGVEDFWDRIASDQILDALDGLQTPIDSLAESAIWNALSDYDDAIAEMLQQRAQDKLAEAAINGELTNYNDMKWSLASIREERITREEEDMALASQILTIAAMLGDPDNPGEGTVYAALVEERTARVTADEALAQNIDALSAVIGDPWNPDEGTIYAAIRDERTVRVSSDEALAQNISALAATIGDPADPAPGTVYAAVVEEREARVTADSALASNITTLQTKVEGNTASVQQAMSSISGIKADWGVKVDVNGRVGGLKLIGGPTSTDMVFNVDTFIIQTPQGGVPPFMVGTVDGRTRTVIKDAFIQDAAISAAKIADASVGKLKVAGHSLSSLNGVFYPWRDNWSSRAAWQWYEAASATVNTEAGYAVQIVFSCIAHSSEAKINLRVRRGYDELTMVDGWWSGDHQTCAGSFVFTDTPWFTGQAVYTVDIAAGPGDADVWRGSWISHRGMVVTHVLR